MRFRDGTRTQKALFALLVGVYVVAFGIAFEDTIERVGQPDIGWILDGANVAPQRADAAAAGLGGGGRAIRVNGIDLQGKSLRRDVDPAIRRGIGETNTLTLK